MHKTKLSLLSIIESIDKVELYTSDFDDGETFYHDQKSFDATMMQFIIIGEMISKLDKEFIESNSNIPWKKIKDFRNFVLIIILELIQMKSGKLLLKELNL